MAGVKSAKLKNLESGESRPAAWPQLKSGGVAINMAAAAASQLDASSYRRRKSAYQHRPRRRQSTHAAAWRLSRQRAAAVKAYRRRLISVAAHQPAA